MNKHLSTLTIFDSLPDTAQVREPVVMALFGCSSPTIWRWAKKGIIPAPHKRLGVTSWNVGELREVLQNSRTKVNKDA